MIVAAGEKARPARRAKCKRDECAAKPNAFRGEAIHVRGLEPWKARALAVFALHDTHRVPSLIVGVNEEEVGASFGGAQLYRGGKNEPKDGRLTTPRKGGNHSIQLSLISVSARS